MKKLIFTLLVIFIAPKLKSQTAIGGSVGVTSLAGSTTGWSSTSNVINSDDSRAVSSSALPSIGSYTDYIVITNFGFSVPASSLIDGIQVNVERRSSSHTTAIGDNSIRLVKAGSVVGDNKAAGGPWANYDINAAYGGAADLWGETWSPADVNNSGFGVAISAQLLFGLAGSAEIDNVTITISSTAALPVELSFFKVENVGEYNVLKWQTTAEIENDYFEIQKSNNGIDFEAIGIVKGMGNSIEVNDYQFVDKKEGESSYYRLKQVDFDGAYEYSDIKLVKSNNSKMAEISVYPNPAESEFRFSGLSSSESNVQIYALNGKLVKEVSISFENSVDVSDLLPGTYYVKRSSSEGTDNHKIIIK